MFDSNFSNAVNIIDKSVSKTGAIFEVMQYKRPRYGGSPLRQIRIKLNNSGFLAQPKDLQFMKGPIHIGTKKTTSNFVGSMGTGERSFTSHYSGKTGEVYLDPSYKHFYMIELLDESIILGDGMFYCCEDSIVLSVHTNKDFSVGFFKGDGFRQPKLSGTGIAILESNVPFEEVLIYPLNNETLSIDGSFAILIRGDIDIKVEKSKNEGFLSIYSGTGEVWIAPTKYNPVSKLDMNTNYNQTND
ncbi:AIM24 family protein [Peptostreptococcaceae bacterium AGR-M142]